MSLRKPLALSAVVIAALTTAVPAATAGAAIMPPARVITFSPPNLPVSDPSTNPQYATCPASYGFKNPATGCASWADYFAYTGGVQPGQ